MSRGGAMREAPDVLVLFPNDWPAYSPTLLNLLHLLGEQVKVRVLALDSRFDASTLDRERFLLVRVPPWLFNFLGRLGLQPLAACLLLVWRARALKARTIIGIDAPGALAAQVLSRGRYFFLSLEIDRGPLFRLLKRARIAALLIQSRERLEYLFGRGDARIPTFLVQNAPILVEAPRAKAPPQRQLRCIFFGVATAETGIVHCIRAAQAATSWTLTVKGMIPADLRASIVREFGAAIDAGRVTLDHEYIAQADVARYLASFDAGLCVYDPEYIARANFNYLSSPSGKMFNYFAAALPVIATDIPGFRPVLENDAGVMLQDLSPVALDGAVQAIVRDYARYSAGSARAAGRYDFAANAAPFVRMVDAAARSI